MSKRQESLLGISLVLVLVLVSSIRIGCQAQSVPGFVSIDCGSSTPYNDSLHQFLWETDDKYIFTGTNANLTAKVNARDNSQALQTFRYFPEKRLKYCYVLPVTPTNSTFLIRVMFLHGGSPLLTLPISFDVDINATVLSSVEYGIYDSADTLNTPVVLEGIFPCQGNEAYICLEATTGVPFISSLEFRLLDPDSIMYSTQWGVRAWLFYLMRYNCGAARNSSTVRYPDDKFDRLWQPPGDWANGLHALTNSTSTPSQSSSADVNNVPPKVMQDAWLNDTANSSIMFSIPIIAESNYVYAAVYAEEIQIEDSGDRRFRVWANGWYLDTYMAPTIESPDLATSSFVEIDNNVLNFTLLARDTSPLGPIVNAVEAYIVYDIYNWSTLAQDVAALADLQVNFNLTDWQGDPCERVPWDWVTCTSTHYYDDQDSSYYVSRIDQILLSNKGISGTIPESISQLEALTEIYLDNNNIHGSIPYSLTSIQNLTVLFLNSNNLSGEIPSPLLNQLGSNFSYEDNENLGGFYSTISPSPSPSSLPRTYPPGPPTSSKKKSNNIGVLVGAVAGGVAGLAAVLAVLIWYFCFRKKKIKSNKEVSLSGVGSFAKSVSYEAVRTATGGFRESIGKGSYGEVYLGQLNDQAVAVKLRNITSDQGLREFMNEVKILTTVYHRNLVSLIGYCNEGNELILIYEYQVNGTLQEWLYDTSTNTGVKKRRGLLSWVRRLQIAADGAMGLEYLHRGARRSIIHRDVKSSNILLDDNFTAKVADFGLSKVTPLEYSEGVVTGVKGTPGYLCPEYNKLGRLTHKSDVYSYGVVIAEIITGRPPFIYQKGNPIPIFVLLEWLHNLMTRNDIRALADPDLGGKFNPETMWKMAEIALACVNPDPEQRPDISHIVRGIQDAIEIEGPMAQPVAGPSKSLQYIDEAAVLEGHRNMIGSDILGHPMEKGRSRTADSPVVESSCYYSIRSKGNHSYSSLN